MKVFMPLLIIFCAFEFSLLAQSSTRDEAPLQAFFQRVWSPYCKGNSLLECPSGKAEDLRDQMRARWQQGQSLDQIETWLMAEYGNELTMVPESSMRGNLAYLIPWLVFFIVVVGLVLYWAKRIQPMKSEEPKASSDSKISDEIQREIEQRLS